MPNMNLGKKARHTASITNRTSTFGIMGGTIQSGNYRNSIRSATYRATTLNKIPPKPTPGKEYMLAHNLLSRNPQCSGGVGRMHTHPGACGPCNCMSSDDGRDPRGGMHDNEVYIYAEPHPSVDLETTILDISFPDPDVFVTSGQPYDWPPRYTIGSSKEGASRGHITFKAGRHKSSEVAKWFVDYIDDNGMVPNKTQRLCDSFPPAGSCQPSGGIGEPKTLNFAFAGTITQGTDGPPPIKRKFILGQGHSGSYNNWFMGIEMDSACVADTSCFDTTGEKLTKCFPICGKGSKTSHLDFYLPDEAR